MTIDKQKRILKYQEAYVKDYDFEDTLVNYRQKTILNIIEKTKPEIVVEVGCGTNLLFNKVLPQNYIKKWIIVEPSDNFTKIAKGENKYPCVTIINKFMEEAVNNVHTSCEGKQIDLIICSGVLHEVPKPISFLSSVASLCRGNEMIHINVPNANSLHRLLAKSMGIIKSVTEMSERNKKLSQYRVYNLLTLKEDVTKSGLIIEESGGYFMKLFTNNQMEKIRKILTKDILNGLWKLGQDLPEFASEIFVNCKKIKD